ncbi:MAG TPA: hypothetical protein VFE58_08240 [Tepidisphaeraceae bacterium]|jgi:hypothetical protein|nr:hypothetical protein [Tepidisphaeraceae bacterium]
MKRIRTPFAALLLSTATLYAQSTQPTPADRYSFNLSPVAPPTPALKYELLFNDADRHPGNAAGLYFDAMLTLGTDLDQKFEKAEEALIDHQDPKTFISIMDSTPSTPELYDELDLAARCEYCDWNSHLRERGIQAILPHLNACRMLGRAVYLRAARQGQLGHVPNALATLRLGYELANKIATEPADVSQVSGLVSVGMIVYFNDALVRLMSCPESPNLYWALCNLPPCTPSIRLDGDRLGTSPPNFPALSNHKLAELSADQWRATLTSLASLPYPERKSTGKTLDPIRDASPDLVQQARDDYARTHSLTPDQAAHIDPAILLGTFYFSQYNIIYDDFCKLRNLPLPIQRTLLQTQARHIDQTIAQQPANPYLPRIPYANNSVETAARADRQLAALTTVEAIRSYAAAHAGSLPPSLADITDTPAPANPMTGQPFDYKLDHNTATLSAADERYPLYYTIQIRK